MVARLCRGVTGTDKADEYLTSLTRTWARDCMRKAGSRGVGVLRRVQGHLAEFILVSLWDSLDSIQDFAGADIERAACQPEGRDLLAAIKPTVEHFEVLSLRLDQGETRRAYGLEQFMLFPLG